MDTALLIESVIKAILMIAILLFGFMYLTYMERRLLGRFQSRIGPNRAGPFGLLQPIADGIKVIFKEELIPAEADKLIFITAPMATVIPALIILAVVPFGGTVTIFGRPVSLSIAGDINVGILYIAAIASISVYGIVLAGWSSNNKYATMGGLRSSAQMISYELALGLSWVGPILLAGSMSLDKIVQAQNPIPFFILQPIAMVIYLIAALAEINRSPFDMPEAEQELTAGYHTEYSGIKICPVHDDRIHQDDCCECDRGDTLFRRIPGTGGRKLPLAWTGLPFHQDLSIAFRDHLGTGDFTAHPL